MISRYSIVLVLLGLLAGCKKEQDPDPPLPEPIRSYLILYNFLMEPYEVTWEANGQVLKGAHPYGIPILGQVNLAQNSQEVNFTVKESGTSQVVQSDLYQMDRDRYYIVAVMGTADNPYILFEPMNLDPPASGTVRVRFMQAAQDLDPLDIFMGGYTESFRVTTGVAYSDITGYVNVKAEDAWHSLTVTPHQWLPADSTLYTFTENEVFEPNRVYLGVMAHLNSSPDSEIHLLLYDQPLAY